jgi:predicted enzyme related to lactoylglutathione lyase
VGVPSCDRTIEHFEKLGGSCKVPAFDMPDAGRIALVADVQGAVVKPYEAESPLALPPRYGPGLFVWNELLTTDIAAARELYAAVFGWGIAEHDLGPMGKYTLFKSNGQDVAGGMNMPAAAGAPAHWLTYLGAEDVDARAKKAESLGAKSCVAPADIPGIGRFSVLTDPTGAMFALYKPRAK